MKSEGMPIATDTDNLIISDGPSSVRSTPVQFASLRKSDGQEETSATKRYDSTKQI